MGYPSNFVIDKNKGNAYKQIGNSVVIPMITEIANQIIKQCFLQKEMRKNTEQNRMDLETIYANSLLISDIKDIP